MHEHIIEDENGEAVDCATLCSDPCHREWCERNDEKYDGWSGCHEVEFTTYCENCGVVLPGFESEDGEPCKCQLDNVVVNRFLSEDGEKCGHGHWIQLPAAMLERA